jgi:oligopeptide/dipeptide ABC transporter ATP-binding protein
VTEILEVEDLVVDFHVPGGRVQAVNGISYSVSAGEIVAIVGESGSGKSVSALAVLGLVPQPPGRVSAGHVRFRGTDLTQLSGEAIRAIRGRHIAMIFQEPMTSLNPVLSIGRQLTEAMRLHLKLSAADAAGRAVELIRTVGISDPERRLKQFPHQLSGGMRQRIMIAMALSCKPELIIADEPTTALDVTIQAQILSLIEDLCRQLGVALIIITHNLGVVARYASRVNVMYAGRIVESGPAGAIYHQPGHPYTIGLLNSVPRIDRPRGTPLEPIPGMPPDLADMGPGCAFAPRCRFAVNRCRDEQPPLEDDGEGHRAACFEREAILQGTAA